MLYFTCVTFLFFVNVVCIYTLLKSVKALSEILKFKLETQKDNRFQKKKVVKK